MHTAEHRTHAATLFHPGDAAIEIVDAQKNVVEICGDTGHGIGSKGDVAHTQSCGGKSEETAAGGEGNRHLPNRIAHLVFAVTGLRNPMAVEFSKEHYRPQLLR